MKTSETMMLTNSAVLAQAYTIAEAQQRQWQADLEALIYDFLELDFTHKVNLDELIPSIDEIQEEMGEAIPYTEKLSDLLLFMREESD